MSGDKIHPLAGAASRALEKANALGGADLAKWNSGDKCWEIASATDPNTVYHVRRKNADLKADGLIERKQTRGPSIGWLFTLDCDCPAVVVSGRAACWHKAAVRLWWSEHSALDGDQIARRNLQKARLKQQLEAIEAEERAEAEDGGGPYQHDPTVDEWDGTDPHAFNRRVAPMDRGLYGGHKQESVQEYWDRIDAQDVPFPDDDPPYYAEEGAQERLPW